MLGGPGMAIPHQLGMTYCRSGLNIPSRSDMLSKASNVLWMLARTIQPAPLLQSRPPALEHQSHGCCRPQALVASFICNRSTLATWASAERSLADPKMVSVWMQLWLLDAVGPPHASEGYRSRLAKHGNVSARSRCSSRSLIGIGCNQKRELHGRVHS